MRNGIFVFIITLSFFACKSDKKNDAPNNQTTTENKEIVETPKVKTYEDKLMDFRDVNEKLTDNYQVESFGMQKIKDSVYSFVFKLNDDILPETVLSYSLGINGFYSNAPAPLKISFNPELQYIEDGKYLVLQRKIEKIRYFDSIDVFIYERKNWAKSGILGKIKIKDILFE